MKRIYAKPWRPSVNFILCALFAIAVAGAALYVVSFHKESIGEYVQKIEAILQKFNSKYTTTNITGESGVGPFSDAINGKKIVELSKIKLEY